MIIGLSGYARSGKDTVAETLVNEYGFKRVAFADKIKDLLYTMGDVITLDTSSVIDVPPTLALKYLYNLYA